jgi:hypothetical protein
MFQKYRRQIRMMCPQIIFSLLESWLLKKMGIIDCHAPSFCTALSIRVDSLPLFFIIVCPDICDCSDSAIA